MHIMSKRTHFPRKSKWQIGSNMVAILFRRSFFQDFSETHLCNRKCFDFDSRPPLVSVWKLVHDAIPHVESWSGVLTALQTKCKSAHIPNHDPLINTQIHSLYQKGSEGVAYWSFTQADVNTPSSCHRLVLYQHASQEALHLLSPTNWESLLALTPP